MKKIILMMMALCAVAFVGCSKDDGNGDGSLVVDGVNLVGLWVELDEDYMNTGLGEWLIEFTNSTYQEYYGGYTFKDGYFYGCTMDDLEPDEVEYYSAEVVNGKLRVAGIVHNIKVIDKDNIEYDYYSFHDEDIKYTRYQRVKGVK